MADRDEILINFQAMTGVEDLAMCIEILEQKDWDLTSAVNSMMPQTDYGAQPPPMNSSSRQLGFIDLTTQSTNEVTVQERDHPYIDLDSSSDTNSAPGSSRYTARVELHVLYGTRTIKVHLPWSSTVAQLKQRLELRTGVQTYRQILKGWPHIAPVKDEDTLDLVGISQTGPPHTLTMEYTPSTPSHPPPPPYSEVSSLPSMLEETIAQSSYRVSPSQEESGVGASLLVGSRVTSRAMSEMSVTVPQSGKLSPVVIPSSDDSSHYSDVPEPPSSDEEPILDSLDDFDDTDTSTNTKVMRDPLIPHGCLEPYEALQFFTHGFEARYGAMHPLFLIGSLSEAVAEATSGNALSGTRKPMFIYLHHDGSILSNIFCSQLLCSESVVNYLTSNYVCWAWDLTHHLARIKLLQMVEECFGKTAKGSVDEIRADHLPAMLIVYKVKGSTEIKNIIQGETNLDSLMTSLITSVDDHNVHIEMEAMEERERMKRELMIAEQNRAYEESLIADREKARQREEEELARAEQERLKEQERNNREEQREAMEVCVPEEPPADCKEKMCTLRIRYPDGSQTTRRFLAIHQLQDLLNLLGSQGYLMTDYKVLTSFPRRDISEGNPSESLEQCKLCPQETLFVEER